MPDASSPFRAPRVEGRGAPGAPGAPGAAAEAGGADRPGGAGRPGRPARPGPHRRRNLLTGDWVLVSPHRLERPWQGQLERADGDARPSYDPGCYLCPGNVRAGGERNPPYTGTYVFTNDYPALLPDPPAPAAAVTAATTAPVAPAAADPVAPPLLEAAAVRGTCRVVCFSPRHDLTLPEMSRPAIRGVVDLWAEQTAELGRDYA